MPAPAIAFATPDKVPRWKRWLLYSAAARIAWFAWWLVVLAVGVQAGTSALGWTDKQAPPLEHAWATLAFQVLPALLPYLLLVRGLERRRLRELAWRDLPGFGGGGLVLGFAIITTVIGVLWLSGSYHVLGGNHDVDWATGLLVAGIGAGVGEEIIARGVLFRIVEEGMGTWWALLVSAAFFGAAHLFNPGATLWSALAIMIEAGVLLALLYHVTRSLWACIGLHAAWNVAEGLIYGAPVSGTHTRGWLDARLVGPDWLTGGAFGPEASVVAVAVCLVPSAVLLAHALRQHSIVPPPRWREQEAPVETAR